MRLNKTSHFEFDGKSMKTKTTTWSVTKLEGAEGGGLPYPFSEISKKCPEYGHLWANFLI